MHKDDLGSIIKIARMNKEYTQEELAEKAGIGLRHLMGIENEGKHPSYEVLELLIHALDISADRIFNPDKVKLTFEQEQVINEFLSCSPQEQGIVAAVLRCLIRELHSPN